MRIHLHLSPNSSIVPFNYQSSLVGAFHKWLGKNVLHDEISLYSLSWLDGGRMRSDKKGLHFGHGAIFSISSPLKDLHKAAIDGIFNDQEIRWGMRVQEVTLSPTPDFGDIHRFIAKSPILIKRDKAEGKGQKYFLFSDPESNSLMTHTLRSKMHRFGLEGEVEVSFDMTYPNPKTRKITYNDIDIRANVCPVVIKGHPEAIQFAWEVGIGNSTGIGFGCLG